jgi:hypothetical protein
LTPVPKMMNALFVPLWYKTKKENEK